MRLRKTHLVLVSALLFAGARSSLAYSVLTHEAIIDSLWKTQLRPLLLQRFPNATIDELRDAHAYVYGGCLIQDMGYAPFSARLMSDLTHYVRSGDFVEALIAESQTLNEYAFALGSLAHYAADATGHPVINRIEPLVYPKLRARFGDVVTYEDKPSAHVKTEFALDVVQVARGLYAPDAYHDFIGFEVEKSALERAFVKTYGIEMKDIFVSEDLAIGTYRFAAGRLIPEATKVAWNSKRKDIEKLNPAIARSKFVYALPRSQYEKKWGSTYRRPGFFARLAAFLFRLIPRFGPFKPLGFRPVPTQGEQMFLKSFDTTVERYRALLVELESGSVKLSNLNLDTGAPTKPAEYRMADEAYIKLVDKLSHDHFASASAGLRENVLEFFSRVEPAKISPKTASQLDELRAASLTR